MNLIIVLLNTAILISNIKEELLIPSPYQGPWFRVPSDGSSKDSKPEKWMLNYWKQMHVYSERVFEIVNMGDMEHRKYLPMIPSEMLNYKIIIPLSVTFQARDSQIWRRAVIGMVLIRRPSLYTGTTSLVGWKGPGNSRESDTTSYCNQWSSQEWFQ